MRHIASRHPRGWAIISRRERPQADDGHLWRRPMGRRAAGSPVSASTATAASTIAWIAVAIRARPIAASRGEAGREGLERLPGGSRREDYRFGGDRVPCAVTRWLCQGCCYVSADSRNAYSCWASRMIKAFFPFRSLTTKLKLPTMGSIEKDDVVPSSFLREATEL